MFKHRSFQFISLTFLASWGFVGAFLGLGGQWTPPYSLLVPTFYMMIPLLVALFLQKGVYKEPFAKPMGLVWRFDFYLLLAWLAPLLLALGALAASLLAPEASYSPHMEGFFERMAQGPGGPEAAGRMRQQAAELPVNPFLVAIANGLMAGATINAFFALGEEVGWRGFLYRQWKETGFWKSSWAIGLVWGLWHAPLVLLGHHYPRHPQLGILMMVVFCLLLSPILSWFRLRNRSVLGAALFHGSLNGVAGLPLLLLAGGSDLTVGLSGLAGFGVLALANGLVWWAGTAPVAEGQRAPAAKPAQKRGKPPGGAKKR